MCERSSPFNMPNMYLQEKALVKMTVKAQQKGKRIQNELIYDRIQNEKMPNRKHYAE